MFLYIIIYYYFYKQGRTIFCVAFTSIIALLLLDKRTSHLQFKILIILNESFINSITKCWYIFIRFVGHVTTLVPIRLGQPKEGQQHYSTVDLPSNQFNPPILRN